LAEVDAKRILCRCACGTEKVVRYTDLKSGGSKSCKKCANRDRMARELLINRDVVLANLRRASDKAKTMAKSKYSSDEAAILAIIAGARDRCTNAKNAAFKNYGGRGIEFCFPNVEAATRWVIGNLGPKPQGKSIDRIDNDRGYEPGNLRWATREEQTRNRRACRGSAYGYRLTHFVKLRRDYTYEGLRKYVLLGYTDEQILTMEKPKGGRKRKC